MGLRLILAHMYASTMPVSALPLARVPVLRKSDLGPGRGRHGTDRGAACGKAGE
jgi:hypothetical protein